MEQQGEVRVNCTFAELMTGQQQVMDLDKYLGTFTDPTPDLPDIHDIWMKINHFHIDLLLCLICPPKCLIPYKIDKLGYLHFDLKKI